MKAGPGSWNNSRKSIAFRFLRYYAIVLLVPVVMSAVVNRMLFGTLRDTAMQNSGAVAQYVTEKLDLQLADIRNYAIDLSVNVQLRGYLFSSGTKDGDVDVIALRRVIEQLPDWNTATGIIEALHVYCNNVNAILTSSTAYLRMETMYGHFFGRPDMDWGTWRLSYLSQNRYCELLPAEENFLDDRALRRFVLVQSIADYVNGVQLGQIMIYIPESAVARELAPLLDMGVAFVALFDSRGQLLASFANEEWADFTDIAPLPGLQGQTLRLRDQEVLVNGADASAFGLKCVTILPLSAIARQVEPMQRAMLIYIACIGGAGLAIAVFAAMRSARPFVMLIRRLKGQHAKHTGIAPIDEAVDGLMENQSRLKQAMQDQNRLLESALSYRLIHGPLPEDELNSMLSFASRDLFSQAYLGVLIDICGEGDERRLRKSSAVIEELLGRIVPSVGFTVALSSRRMAVLYLRREPDGEDAVPFFTTLYRLLSEQYGINTCFWVGKEVRALNDAHESFQSATHLADASAQDGARYIVTYAHPQYSAGSFHYGRAEAGELECLVKAGRLEELLSALGRIRAANLDRISVFQGKLLLCALTDTLLRASEEILRMPEDAEEKAQLDRMLPAIPEGALPWGFGQLERCFTLLCQAAVARKKSRNAELAGRVRAYVEAHFCEESLSLQRVSLEFGMNERYLSTFYREQFGENLQAYITRLRVEEANRLMRETDLPLSAIAERVGYVNPNTFRSAYNRTMGYNPSDYERRTTHETATGAPGRTADPRGPRGA